MQDAITSVKTRRQSTRAFTVARVGEIWSMADLEAFDAVCRELNLRAERVDGTQSKSVALNMAIPVVIEGRTATHKAKSFVERMRELTGADWRTVELPDQPSADEGLQDQPIRLHVPPAS